uniref:Trafficking protein particle complex subunit n=1 Tax=Steinernema glaseri TaxID=37863 RepID=A0A1I8AIS5_9BILA
MSTFFRKDQLDQKEALATLYGVYELLGRIFCVRDRVDRVQGDPIELGAQLDAKVFQEAAIKDCVRTRHA